MNGIPKNACICTPTHFAFLVLLALLPAAAPAACNPDGTELCCDSVVETNCLSFSRPSWGGVSATNDCDGASFVLTSLQSGSVRYEIVQSWTPKPGYDGKCPDPEPAFTVRELRYPPPKAARALSPSTPDKLFTYRVLKPFEVINGRTAPAFGELGFGVQYETPVPISILLKRGIVEEVK